MHKTSLVLIVLCATGCADVPQLNRPMHPDLARESYPSFLSPDELRRTKGETAVQPELGNLSARLARLNSRAARLRRPILTKTDQNRLTR